MSIRQGFSFKLKPNGAQDKKMSRFAGCTRWGSSSKVPFNKEENGHLSCVTGISPCEPKLKRDFEEFPWVYNQGLAWNEERRTADPAFHLSYAKLCTELLVWKEQNPWLRETHSQVLQQSLKDLMDGFQKFFKGLTAFPKKHKKFVTTDSFRFPQGFKIDEGRRQIY